MRDFFINYLTKFYGVGGVKRKNETKIFRFCRFWQLQSLCI